VKTEKFDSNLPAVQETYRARRRAADSSTRSMSRKPRMFRFRTICGSCGGTAGRSEPSSSATVLATLVVSLRLTPIYESTTTIDIDRQMPTGVLGQEALQNATNDADQFLATQVKLIQSDSVLRPGGRQVQVARGGEGRARRGHRRNPRPAWKLR
jgi:hypothetical protein